MVLAPEGMVCASLEVHRRRTSIHSHQHRKTRACGTAGIVTSRAGAQQSLVSSWGTGPDNQRDLGMALPAGTQQGKGSRPVGGPRCLRPGPPAHGCGSGPCFCNLADLGVV